MLKLGQGCRNLWTRMQPRRLAPCDVPIFLLSGFTFHTLKLARCPWQRRFEMVKRRAESERDPALCCPQCHSCFVAAWCREGKEEGRYREVLRRRRKGKKEQARERAGSSGLLSHPLRLPVLSLTHRPTFYLTYLPQLST